MVLGRRGDVDEHERLRLAAQRVREQVRQPRVAVGHVLGLAHHGCHARGRGVTRRARDAAGVHARGGALTGRAQSEGRLVGWWREAGWLVASEATRAREAAGRNRNDRECAAPNVGVDSRSAAATTLGAGAGPWCWGCLYGDAVGTALVAVMVMVMVGEEEEKCLQYMYKVGFRE